MGGCTNCYCCDYYLGRLLLNALRLTMASQRQILLSMSASSTPPKAVLGIHSAEKWSVTSDIVTVVSKLLQCRMFKMEQILFFTYT